MTCSVVRSKTIGTKRGCWTLAWRRSADQVMQASGTAMLLRYIFIGITHPMDFHTSCTLHLCSFLCRLRLHLTLQLSSSLAIDALRPCHNLVAFAADFQVDMVSPIGLSVPCASSELLQAGIALHTGGYPEDCLISGAAADIWAAGSVLLHMVTGGEPLYVRCNAKWETRHSSRPCAVLP